MAGIGIFYFARRNAKVAEEIRRLSVVMRRRLSVYRERLSVKTRQSEDTIKINQRH